MQTKLASNDLVRKHHGWPWLGLFDIYTEFQDDWPNLHLTYVSAEEMDWDKNGLITFKEFLFAFTNWVNIKDEDDLSD